MKTNFEDRIADLEQKYLGVAKNKTKTDKPNASSGTIQIPNLVGMSTQQADTIAIQNGAKILRVHDVKEAVECVQLFKAYQA